MQLSSLINIAALWLCNSAHAAHACAQCVHVCECSTELLLPLPSQLLRTAVCCDWLLTLSCYSCTVRDRVCLCYCRMLFEWAVRIAPESGDGIGYLWQVLLV
jgi:hypothetical protein